MNTPSTPQPEPMASFLSTETMREIYSLPTLAEALAALKPMPVEYGPSWNEEPDRNARLRMMAWSLMIPFPLNHQRIVNLESLQK